MMEVLCKEALTIFRAAVNSVKPDTLIRNVMRVNVLSSTLEISENKYNLAHNVYVVGFGKAVVGMAASVERLLGDHIISGIISAPKDIKKTMSSHRESVLKEGSKIEIFEGAANNLPDEDSMHAASRIAALASSLTAKDLLLVLISGGGSALLPSTLPSITLSEKLQVIKLLTEQGATIQELNSVRKRLSVLKGGGLATLAAPTNVLSLILSDIIGDPLDLIASGPTVQNSDNPSLPLDILKRYHILDKVPKNVRNALRNISQVSSSPSKFDHVTNVLLGNNKVAAIAGASTAEELGYGSMVLSLEMQGLASEVGSDLIKIAKDLLKGDVPSLEQTCGRLALPLQSRQKLKAAVADEILRHKGLCLICAGETVVKVRGKGIGGRNQELALSSSIELSKNTSSTEAILLLSAGTDGIDGPTYAAGAIATPEVVQVAKANNINASEYLENNDSFTFYKLVGDGQWHVTMGHSGTNVMDIIVILIKKKF